MFHRSETNNSESTVEEGKGDGEKEKFLENLFWGYFTKDKSAFSQEQCPTWSYDIMTELTLWLND